MTDELQNNQDVVEESLASEAVEFAEAVSSAVEVVSEAGETAAEAGEESTEEMVTIRVKKRRRAGRRHHSASSSNSSSSSSADASSTNDAAAGEGSDASESASSASRRHKEYKPRMSTPKKVALIVVGVILALLVAGGIALGVAVKMGSVNLHALMNWEDTPEEVQTEDQGQTITYKGQKYRYNENVVSILLMGLDDETMDSTVERPDAKCNDVNLLVTMDTETNAIRVMAIPRDTQVDVDLYNQNEFAVTKPLQLCLAYSTDLKKADDCALNACKSVSRILYGLPVNYYVTIEERGLIDAADAVGGIKLKALETIPNTPIVKGEEVLLQGENAFKYVQSRDCDIDESAQDRLARQKQFLEAFLNQLRSAGLSKAMDVYGALKSEIGTNIGASEAAYLISCFANGKSGSMEFTTLKGKVKMLKDDDGIEREHVYLKRSSVMDAIVAAYYQPVK